MTVADVSVRYQLYAEEERDAVEYMLLLLPSHSVLGLGEGGGKCTCILLGVEGGGVVVVWWQSL